ncbi:MAG: DUF533 domain-containing protein [Pseudomonadota bacterium]
MMNVEHLGQYRVKSAAPGREGDAVRRLPGPYSGGLAVGLLANAVGGRKMRKFARAAARLGGAAAIGGLAWRAYNRFRGGDSAEDSLSRQAMPISWQYLAEAQFIPTEARETEVLELLILRAIIAAANADGLIDWRERMLILSRVEAMNASACEKEFLSDEIESPMSYKELAGLARTPELAAKIYAASLMPLDSESQESRAYLGALAQSMGLPLGLVRELDRDADVLNAETRSAAVA